MSARAETKRKNSLIQKTIFLIKRQNVMQRSYNKSRLLVSLPALIIREQDD